MLFPPVRDTSMSGPASSYQQNYPLWPYSFVVQEVEQGVFIGFVDFHTAGWGWHQMDGVHQTNYYRVHESAEDACLQWLAMCRPRMMFPKLYFKNDRPFGW